MAQSFVTDQGTLIIPGSYATYQVAAENAGLAVNGVLMLVGEADAGPDYTLEEDVELNAFGPDQIGDVVSKYRSGPLVDAFRAACAPANDPGITGSPSRMIIVKTNASTKATANITKWDSSVYGVLADKSYGKLGNLISTTVTAKQAEVIPTTGAFTWIPNVGTVSYEIRVNGGAAETGGQLAANRTPAAFQAAVNALTGLSCTGGADRAFPPANGNVSLAVVSGNTVTVTFANTLAVTPTAGDTFIIPAGSVLAGTGNANVGAYVVTAATTTSVTATKLSDAAKPGAVAGVVTVPLAVVATPLSGTPANDVQAFAPVTITLAAANPIDGVGKSIEIAELTAGTDLLSRCLYQLNTTPVTWVSKSGAPALLTSSAEYIATITNARQLDAVTEDLSAGGEIALTLGYVGTTASVVVTDTTLTITVAGGTGTSQTFTLADWPTLADLAAAIASKTGFKCSVGSGILGQIPSTALDNVTTTGSTTWGAQTCRLKIDAYRMFNKIANESALVQLQDTNGVVVQAGAGLPQPQSLQFLTGGTKGGTTSAAVSAAFDKLQAVRGNFLVPLFSRDATLDIADGLTEAASTYQIDSINAAAKSHVLAMSTLKKRRNRQAFLSKRNTFLNDRLASANIASFRCAMTFLDVKNVSNDGTLKQYQPWMGAVLAAAMQAAGFYRPIVNKGINCSGFVMPTKDFDDRIDSNVEDALTSGLLPMKRADGGGFVWTSDQTTYGKDSNFVFNSIQATYIADVIAMTTAQRMEKAFVGQSVADISAALALSFLQAIMSDFLRLKLISASDDAPKGFKNARIQIKGPAMIVSLEVKLAGAIYFIPISFLVSQVQQTATA